MRALDDARELLELAELEGEELAAMGRVCSAFAFYGPWARARTLEPGELADAVRGARLAIDDVRHVGGRWCVRFARLASVELELARLNARNMLPGRVPVGGNGP